MGRLVLLLALLAAASACGGGSTETVTVGGATETTTVTLAPEPTTSTPAQPALTSRTFQMPSKNIGCTDGENVLVCDILSGLNPEPDEECELDWTGMEMERLGPAQPRCAGDTAYDLNAPVLEYGQTWERGGFNCVSKTTGLGCTNEDGQGFTLSREQWTQF